jgi:hypothetical protein
VLLASAALLVGLSAYLYLPIRYSALPAFNYAGHYQATGLFSPIDLRTPAGLWWLISGRAFAGEMLAYQGWELWPEVARFGVLLWRVFFTVGIGPGVLGMVVLVRRDWRLGSMTLLMFVCSAGFYIDYRVVDKETMFLPAYLIWALWLGVGYQWLLDWLAEAGQGAGQGWSEWIARGVIVGAVVLAAAWNWRQVDLSSDWSTRLRGEQILQDVQPDALVFGWWDTVPLIE